MIKLNGRVLINGDKLVVLTARQASTLRALALCRPGMVAEDMLLKASEVQPHHNGGHSSVNLRICFLRTALRTVGSYGVLSRISAFGVVGYVLGDEIEVVQ